MDKGVQGPQALDFLIRVLSKELSTVSPNAVVSELQNLVVAPGTPFKEYMSTLRSLVQNARSVGHIAPQDSTLQLAVRESVCDQYSLLSADVFKGRDERAVPYGSIDELMEALELMSWNTAAATAVRRKTVRNSSSNGVWNGSIGKKGSGQHFNSQSSGKSFGRGYSGRVMTVHDEMEDEKHEFKKVYNVALNRTDNTVGVQRDPPFYVRFTSLAEKDKRRHEYKGKCLNCASSDHFVRDCDQGFLNDSGMLNPDLGNGTPTEVAARWKRWLERLRQWFRNRNN
ncbi:unnamed protein product [Pylaiella littoralis]